MLAVIAAAVRCCRPEADDGSDQAPVGVCVCEVQTLQALAQSKASYHLRVLREAGILCEARRSKRSFCTLDTERARGPLAELTTRLGA